MSRKQMNEFHVMGFKALTWLVDNKALNGAMTEKANALIDELRMMGGGRPEDTLYCMHADRAVYFGQGQVCPICKQP